MNHNDVLKKKALRLAKYSGGKLRHKERALIKAQNQFGMTAESPQTRISPTSTKPVTIETGEPEWVVKPPEGNAFKVRASSEKKARAEARKVLKIRTLLPGTKVEKTS